MSLQVNCDLTDRETYQEKTMQDNQEDWEQDDWELDLELDDCSLPPSLNLEEEDVKEEQSKEECEFCDVLFKDINALRQHHRTCSPCAVALSKFCVRDSELFAGLKEAFRTKPELVNSLRIALFSVLKNKDDVYRTRHSRWLLWWMTKMALVKMGKDNTISLMDCGRLLKTNLEESVMLSKKNFCWENDPATNMWVKRFKDLLQMRKIDNLEQFVLLETASKILAAQQEFAKKSKKRTPAVRMTKEDKDEEMELATIAMELKKRIGELHGKVPIGTGDPNAKSIEKTRNLVCVLEAIEEQREVLDLPIPRQGANHDFGGGLFDDSEFCETIILEIKRLTDILKKMRDPTTNFLDVWKEWWNFTKEVHRVLFNNPLDIIRKRFLEEKDKLKVPQKKKMVVELGQLLKSKQAQDKAKMVYLLYEVKFIEECQMFFKS